MISQEVGRLYSNIGSHPREATDGHRRRASLTANDLVDLVNSADWAVKGT